RIAGLSARTVLAIGGGYALTLALSAGLAVGLAKSGWLLRGEAVLLAAMLAFIVYPCIVIAVFVTRRARDQGSLRSAFSWLHTWAGVGLGGVLFAMFWMGSLAVFDREIDRWMMPATRLPPAPAEISLDRMLRGTVERIGAGTEHFSAVMPTHRTPTLQVRYVDPQTQERVLRHVDPRSGEVLETGSLGGTGFIYPFHYDLHIDWQRLGIWIAGFAGLAMLILIVSGVVIHRRLFADFFVFRPQGKAIRSTLDLHNVTGVLALPFHFVITLSGLIIFFSIFFNGTWRAVYGADEAAFGREIFGTFERPKSGARAELGSLDAMLREAQARWGGGQPAFVQVRNPGDAAGYVGMNRSTAHRVAVTPDQIYFDAASGSFIQRAQPHPLERVQRFIAGMHRVQFDSWALRWFYFFAGLSGCVMIATGFLYWMEARRVQHASNTLGFRIVQALTIGSVSGIIASTMMFFVVNRCLPLHVHVGETARDGLEMWTFYLTWLATFAHAAVRGRRAWAEQCWAIAALAFAAVGLNWITTGDHPLRAIAGGRLNIACVDAMLVLGASVAALSARRLQRQSWSFRSAPDERQLESARG
ncbi:MAG TPA: PepSY-associated TM helix domain-containing protein, partial [Polyangiales bacterium]|nr:PepSY-associated TM helix domain-containing protein [Polyangiales bacterium]